MDSETANRFNSLSYVDEELLVVLAATQPKTAADLMETLNSNRTFTYNSLNNLSENGVVLKHKDPTNTGGRPRYAYSIEPAAIKPLITHFEQQIERATKALHLLRLLESQSSSSTM